MEVDRKLGFHESVDDNDTCSVIEQYATDVRSFSSQYGSEISISYTAYNICGKPSKFPAYGDFPQTFVMVRSYLSVCTANIIMWRDMLILIHLVIPC